MNLAPKKIRLFVFIHDLAPFGAQKVAFNIVKYLDKDKFAVTVCSFWGDETLSEGLKALGAEVMPLRARRFLDAVAWLRLFRILTGMRPDIVQTNMPELSLPVRLLAPFLPGTRLVHTVQNPLSSEPWYWRAANAATLPLCDMVVFCSQSMKEAFAPGRRTPAAKLRAIQNGIELDVPGPGAHPRSELGIGPEEKVICCVARLAEQKGQDVLIRAFAEMVIGTGRRLRLLLAGDGEDAEKLKALASGLGVADKVVFCGRRSDIYAILKSSDIYAAPSRWEGLGLSLGEAMLAGVPCVGTAISGHADILQDGITGVAVPPEDPSALAAGILRLLDDPAAAGAMAEAASKLIRAGFTMEGMAGRYEKMYMEISGR